LGKVRKREGIMKLIRVPICLVFLAGALFFFSAVGGGEETNKWTRLVDRAGTIITEIQQMPDNSIPEDLLRGCKGVAIFPDTISGGFGIGGKYGQGIIMVRDDKGLWSPPAIFTIGGASLGWQIGGQATDIVLLLMGDSGVKGILQGKLKLGADASVAAGPVGRDTEASTNVKFGGILAYSRARGLFIGVKLEGAVITQHWAGDKALYGKDLSADDILLAQKAKMPSSADKVLGLLNKYPYKK
jgi:lipid-binding SYLF domain-containing protein